jgi:hypothetical protein
LKENGECDLSDVGSIIGRQPMIEGNGKDQTLVFVKQAFPGTRVSRTTGLDQITI